MLQQGTDGRGSLVMRRQAPLRSAYAMEPERALIHKVARTFSTPGDDALHGSVRPGDDHDVSWRFGVDRAIGGLHDAPNPGELLCAALAACQHASIRMVADAMGVAIEHLEVEVTGSVDARGCMGMGSEAAVGFTDLHCRAHLRAAEGTRAELVAGLIRLAERCCINLATMRDGVPVRTDFEVIG